jgi:hypothetical protein
MMKLTSIVTLLFVGVGSWAIYRLAFELLSEFIKNFFNITNDLLVYGIIGVISIVVLLLLGVGVDKAVKRILD